MRVIKLFTALLFALALAGCVKEQDLENCSGDVTLLFRYTLNGHDDLEEKVSSIDLFIFDDEGLLVEDHHLDRSILEGSWSTQLTLTPGVYKVVGWANVLDHSAYSSFIPGVTTFDECFLQIESTVTGDPVYYTPYKGHPESPSTRSDPDWSLIVPPGQSVTKELDFVRAHRTINVYVKGIETLGRGATATVDATALWSKYNFYFDTQTSRQDFSQQAVGVITPDGAMQLAAFNFAFGEIDDNIAVTVKAADNSVVANIIQGQYLRDHPTADNDDINIVVNFLADLSVSITVPEWDSENVTPKID